MSKSERWSSASSDSDVSFVLFGGEHRGDNQGSYASIHDTLKEKVAFLSGGKDRRGGPVITIPTRGPESELKTEDFKRLLTYLAGLPSNYAKDQGFSIVVDMRGSTWSAIKPVLKSLQECFPSKIQAVYIIKPEGFWERHKASSGSGKFSFEVTFTSLEGLCKYIDRSNLTPDFGGSLLYDHDQWVMMQMALEKFNFEAMSLLTKLEEIHEGLIHQDFADNLVGLREQVKHNQHVRKWIIKAPIETLEEEGRRLLGWINDNKMSPNSELVNTDLTATSSRITNILESLHGKRQKLKDSWHIRKHRLDQCIQYHLFQLDAEKMRQWIRESEDDVVANFSEVGSDSDTASQLQMEHIHIQDSCSSVSENIKQILEGAEKLLESDHYESELIETISASLEQEWKQFIMDIDERGKLLACSVAFHKKSEEFLRRVRLWQDRLHDESFLSITDVGQLSDMLENENNLKQEIDLSYEAVSSESKQLLEALQKPLIAGDERDTPEFSEAASHVMELFLNVHEHNRQLGILWDKKHSGLREQIHLLSLDQDIAQVIKWIDEHGEPFLKKHTDVGRTAEKAEALLKRHQEFETIVQNTYTNADQIRYGIKELEESGECRPEEVKKRTQYFEKRVCDFKGRVDERRRILEQAVSFYSNADSINQLVDKVKALLEVEELSDDPDDIAKVLLRLRHDCERALENISQSIHDGRTIVEHVNQGDVLDTRNPESCEHLEKLISDLEAKKSVIEVAWIRRREQMELWQQLWEFERDGEQVKNRLESCEAELEKDGLADQLSGAKQMLSYFQEQLKAIDTLSLRTFCKGEELIDLLRHSDVELRVRNPSTPETIDAHHHIQNLLEFLHNQRSAFLAFADTRRKKLEQRVALKQLEADTKQAIGCIRNGENMLLSNINPGFNFAEAKDSIMEYEQFKTAMEKTSQRVASIRDRAKDMAKQNHPEPEMVMGCSEQVSKRWQQLMKKASEKQHVVWLSYDFFKTSEQVSGLLQKVLKEYKIGDDPCAKYSDLELRDKCSVITSLLENHAKEREEIAKGHEAVYSLADAFLKNVAPTAENGGVPSDGSRQKMEQQVKEISELIRGQKKFALDLWNVKNTVLGQCKEFLDFEGSAKEALEWIHDHGEFYLSTNSSIPDSEDETKARYNEHKRFTEVSEVYEEIKEKVKCLLQEADELYKQSCFHSEGITQWATAVDKRFKDFASRMTKYLNQLEAKLGFPITKFSESDEEMPEVSVLSQTQQQHQQSLALREKTLNLRELSKDSGIHELMEEEKRKSARRKEFIMNELLHTERTYVNDLKCIIQNYTEAMDGNPAVPAGLVGKEDVIFGNMREIFDFHNSVFLNALEKYETHPEDVGECFAERAEQFKMYVFYCKNKTLSNNLLIEHGGTFFSDLQASYNHGLSIAAYLIKPVQRITKYQLLLKDLLSCCEGSEKSLEAGLEVMLGVPRQANDEMSISLIRGFDEHIHCLGRILLQDVFVIWDAKSLRRKGKERHLFLFQQALLVTKEMKDAEGKVVYWYKYKLKCSDLGVTEHIAEDGCKFAIWTGLPPNNDDRKILKAHSLDVKQNWVKQLRSLQQQFQFGILRSRTMSTCLRKDEKNPDRESGVVDDDRVSWDFEYNEKGCDETCPGEHPYYTVDNYQATGDDEVPLKKGQLVEILESPAHSPRWRIRYVTRDSDPQTKEGWVPTDLLRRQDESRRRRNSDGSLCSSEDSNSLSSCNDLSPAASLYNSPGVLNGSSSPPSRRRAKSTGQFGTLRMKPWRRESMKKNGKSPQASPLPRNTRISGGGSKKLQALLGASENDIDLLIKPKSSPLPSGLLKHSESCDEDLGTVEVDGYHEVMPEDEKGELSLGASDDTLQSVESLKESQESLLDNDEETNNGVEGEDVKDCEDPSEEDKEAVALKKRMYVIKELIHTEQDYVKDLESVVQGYIPELSKEDVPEELKGKEGDIFGNMRQILEWHKTFFCKEIEKCEDAPERIGSVFLKAAKRLEMYIHYCQKKPKSEGLVREFEDTYFQNFATLLHLGNIQDLKTLLGHRLALSDYLIKPVQRIMKYQLLLRDILKYTERANLDSVELKKALDIMKIIPKKANDMMNVGMLEGYTGNVKAQGDLILQDIVQVTDAKAKTKPAKRRVFVFEQMIIFSEPFERKKDWTVFIYRHSIKTNFMGLTETVADDPCKFAIWTTRSPSEIYLLKAETKQDKDKWIRTLKQLLEHLKQFANEVQPCSRDSINIFDDDAEALVNPIEYQGGNNDPLGLNSITSSEGQVTSCAVTEGNARNLLSPSTESLRRHSSAGKTLSAPQSRSQVRHFSLIPLNTAKNLEDLTGAFSEGGKDRYISIDDYKAKAKDQISINKGDIFFVVSSKKRDKKWLYGHVAGGETLGLVPARVLQKDEDDNHVNEDDVLLSINKTKLTRKHSFPSNALRRVTQKKSKDEFFSHISEGLKFSIEKFQSELDPDSPSWRANETPTDVVQNGKTVTTMSPVCRLELRDVIVDRPNTLRLSCEVMGHPTPTFQWQKDSKDVEANDRIKITQESFRCTLEIAKSEFEDSGVYTCTAMNDMGHVTTSCIAQVRDKPSSPSRPTVTEITGSSVIVKWSPPDSDGNSPITAYTVECKETGVSHWQAPVPFVSTTSTVVDDLTPGSVYQFRVSANNVVGISKPSPPTETITLDVGNGKPQRDLGRDPVTWKQNIDEYHNVYAELGRGRYSVVKKCVDKISGKEYAAKFIKKRMCSQQDVEREVLILRRLKHPNLNFIVDSFENDKNWILVVELLPSGRLFDSIVVASVWTEKEAVGFVQQMLEAVQHLHDCRVAHLDLKPENLLLDGGPIPKVKLIDFGNAFTMSKENIIPDLHGNPEFSAPELIRGLPVTVETDVWSIGVIVHVMLTGVSPFYDEHVQTMCDNISKGHYGFDAEYMTNISDEAKCFIRRLLIREQWRRPECSDCLDMTWMKMISSRSPFPVPVVRLNTSRLASFNARRRKIQHEVTNIRPLLLTEKGESNV